MEEFEIFIHHIAVYYYGAEPFTLQLDKPLPLGQPTSTYYSEIHEIDDAEDLESMFSLMNRGAPSSLQYREPIERIFRVIDNHHMHQRS